MVSGTGVVVGESVGDCLEMELGVALETGLNVSVTKEAAVDVLGVEEGDVDAGDTEELC